MIASSSPFARMGFGGISLLMELITLLPAKGKTLPHSSKNDPHKGGSP